MLWSSVYKAIRPVRLMGMYLIGFLGTGLCSLATAQTPYMVKDIQTQFDSSLVSQPFACLRGNLYFSAAENNVTGTELWRSNGTSDSTYIAVDLRPTGNGLFYNVQSIGDVLYANATDGVNSGLWRSDGTPEGTLFLNSVQPKAQSGGDTFWALGEWVLFAGDDGVNGVQLWRTDGTPEGTSLLKIIHPSGDANPYGGVVFKDELYFGADDGEHGFELWRSKGTNASTRLTKDINFGPSGSGPLYLTVVGERLFLSADDGSTGMEPWASDGTGDGTYRVKNINTSVGIGPLLTNSAPSFFVDLAGVTLFAAQEPAHGAELWRSDGTEDGTTLVKDIDPASVSIISGNSRPNGLTNLGGTVIFGARVPSLGYELWRTDGTEAGTTLLKEFYPGTGTGVASPLTATTVNGVAYFSATEGALWEEPARSDGTESGTYFLGDVNPGGSSSPKYWCGCGGLVYFSADDGVHGRELWAYNVPPLVEGIALGSPNPAGRGRWISTCRSRRR